MHSHDSLNGESGGSDIVDECIESVNVDLVLPTEMRFVANEEGSL